ncbi:cytochrome P450 [Leptolyngbya sp. Heron Island J]|uniref:cytochrome P450 n=1 Tax=Leptolyngbya sp. Heron Island J TaxID=1385935 RepID=UPI0013774AAE|nr:cytochrome P450 [Leptolyngbya sp. Heron Island J]
MEFLFLLAAGCLGFRLYSFVRWKYVGNQLPGPPSDMWFGNLREIKQYAGFFDYLPSMHKQYGKIFRFWMGPTNLIVSINDQEILAETVPLLHQRPETARKELGWLGKESPTFKCHEELREIRTTIMPLLVGKSLDYLCLVGRGRMEKMLDNWAISPHGIRAEDVLRDTTFDIIGVTLFGQEFISTSLGRSFRSLFVEVMREAHPRSQEIIPAVWDYRYWRWKQKIRKLHSCAEELIKQRRCSSKTSKRKDLLSLLLNEKDENRELLFSDEQARATIVTFVFAGFDTSAASLTWILYLLATHTDAQRKAQREIDCILAGRPPQLEDLASMSYLTCVVKEGLRMYPPVPEALRKIDFDIQREKYFIPNGATLVIPISTLHADAENWEKPYSFVPERFDSMHERKQPRYSYLPFGAGPKSCMGARFAMTEIRLMLSMILQRFSVELAPNQDVVPEMYSIILQPKYGLKINVIPRKADMMNV